MAALAQHVDFGQLRANESEPAAKPQARTGSLHKGMLLQDVEAQLDPPTATTERKENLKMVRREYSSPMGRVTAWFAEGVLIRYTLTSE